MAKRFLVVVADDFGIGPGTSQAILELGQLGRVTGTTLLVNSPFAGEAIEGWKAAGKPLDMGWHPNLTLDRPVSNVRDCSSLVDREGKFCQLPVFLKKVHLGQIKEDEVERELRGQLNLYREMVGDWPQLINSHQHCSLFGSVDRALTRIIGEFPIKPWVRRVREPWSSWFKLPGGRIKRLWLGYLGRRQGRKLDAIGIPGPMWMLGLTDPDCLEDDDFFVRWIRSARGGRVELMCHPGYEDLTLIGRDSPANDPRLYRRLAENRLLRSERFIEAIGTAGFTLTRPQVFGGQGGGPKIAA